MKFLCLLVYLYIILTHIAGIDKRNMPGYRLSLVGCLYQVIPTLALKFPPVTTEPAQLFTYPGNAGVAGDVGVAGDPAHGKQDAGILTEALAAPVAPNTKCSGNPDISAGHAPV